MPGDGMIPCVKETRPDIGGNNWCIWRLDQIGKVAELFDGADVGETVTLEYCEMTQAELDALPEFEGW